MRTQLHRLTAMAGVFVLLTLTGCNTVQGLGKDIEKGGEAIQKVAK
ncbi:MAG TPA: entericidin A/B family lipoprotein [Zoogloea sp.]|jgi:predicted small secreted protein|nr:entericidin A/B family lipoprotein [Zoogloea sp.]